MNVNKSDDTRFTEIQKDIKGIRDLLQKSARSTKSQSFFSTGITVVIASLAVLPYNVWLALVMFIAGYLLMTFSPRIK